MGLKSPQYLAMEMLMKFMIAVIYLLALIACIFSIRFRTMRARDWIALAMVSFLGLGCFADFAVNWGWLDPPANMQELRIGQACIAGAVLVELILIWGLARPLESKKQ